MDIREHSVALISVVIGRRLTSLFGNFNRLMRRRGEIRWDALPLAWALIALMLVNNYWWGFTLAWSRRRPPRMLATSLSVCFTQSCCT